MTFYNVHVYREMRLTFEGIEADTPGAAAMIVRDGLTEDADAIEDCNGEDLSVLIDIIGDDNYERSVTIDFEPERMRKATPELLAALQAASDWIEAQVFVPRTSIQATIQAAIAKAAAGQGEREAGMTSVRADVYSRVTDHIVAQLEAGTRPWLQPWQAVHAAGEVSRPLRFNALPYRGINVVLLWMAAMQHRFTCPLWMTYRQAAELGGQVRRGKQGSLVVYANSFTRRETGDDGEEHEREVPFLKSYSVFNAEQIDGLPSHYYAQAEQRPQPVERIERAERFFGHTGANIRHGGSMAYYAPASDRVHMPAFESFRDAESYYVTLGHECCHWTKHGSRLAREFGRQRWGDEGYSMEELVAELGAAFLCADLGLAAEVRDDHAAYIASWLKVLRNDKRAVFTAAAHAQRAADYLHQLQPSG